MKNKIRCRSCRKSFAPTASWVKWCSDECRDVVVKKLAEEQRKQRENNSKEVLRKMKEKQKDLPYYKRQLREVLHKYIRLRDANKPCAACGRSMVGRKGDVSHFWSAGSYPNLKFDERNIHLCCVPCNQFRGGNLVEYGLRLPSIIGREQYEQLASERNKRASFTIPDLKEKIAHYKAECKRLTDSR